MGTPKYIATANWDLDVISIFEEGATAEEAYAKFLTESLERHCREMATCKKALERFIIVRVYTTRPPNDDEDDELDWYLDKVVDTHKPDISSITNKPLIVTELINTELDKLYEPDQIDEWWKSGQPLLDDQLPKDLIESGHGNEVLRLLRCMNDGAYI